MDFDKRIGDIDRDAAVQSLREHTSVGRLSLEEFDERMAAALSAKTRGDLVKIFEDLPGGLPGTGPTGQLRPRTAGSQVGRRGAGRAGGGLRKVPTALQNVLVAAIWVVFLVGAVSGMVSWWLFWIPVIASTFIKD